MPPAAGPYLAAFSLLQRDFQRLSEYVAFNDDNLPVYSHRMYELLLRGCTEFESLCKELLVERAYAKKPSDMTVMDYRMLEGPWHFELKMVGVLSWLPRTAYIQPFAGWSTADPPLPWYSSYNRVKHNRHRDFVLANLDNVRLALAGLFALMAETGMVNSSVASFQERAAADGRRELICPGYDFSIITS